MALLMEHEKHETKCPFFPKGEPQTSSSGSSIVFGPCQQNLNRPLGGVGHCVVGGFLGRVGCEGAHGMRGREGTTRAGKGGLYSVRAQTNLKLHAVAALFASFLGLLPKRKSPKAEKI